MTGKSAMMLALIVALLDHRQCLPAEERVGCPVPVWLTAADWDAEQESLRAWTVRMLARDYRTLLCGQADVLPELMASGRLALFIDGLDEMRPENRAAAIRRLVHEDRALRITVACRTAEFREVGGGRKGGIPLAVISPRPVPGAEAGEYLLAGHPTGDAVLQALRGLVARIAADPSGPLAQACASPLTLSLINDVYGEDGDPAELLDAERFGTARLIQGHLLARAFNRAYPEERGWAAKREWLRWLAVKMGQDRNLRWWQIPSWTPAWGQRTVISLLAGPLVGVALGMVISPLGAGIGAVLGIIRAGFLAVPKEPVARWAPRRPTAGEMRVALGYGLLQVGCILVLAASNGLWGWAGYPWLARAHLLPGGAGVAVALGLTVGIAGGMQMILTPGLAMCQLFFMLTGRPVNFTTLLREAHTRKVLRQVGSVYQFASAELQDELRKSGSAIS